MEQGSGSRSSRTTVHTTGDSPSGALLPFLDQEGIEAALRFVQSNWPHNAPMTADEREGWLDVLPKLRQGELRQALLERRDDKSHRPKPYGLLETVQAMRERATAGARARQMVANQAEVHELHQQPHARETNRTDMSTWFARQRAVLRGEVPTTTVPDPDLIGDHA